MNLTDAERAAFEKEQRAQAAADRDYGCALWYAWGRLDAGGYGPNLRAKADAFKFAESVKVNSLRWHRGDTRDMLESIQGQWDNYIDSL